mmetsp:Transcript_36218/g.101982  ORF Transcript_36218/g.101982 Transcript_36218/m.101982 type:complete len:246 (+) Transcript_36218:3-740(+)
MDHHCNFAWSCIGFSNMRCFLVWLSYGHLLMALLLAATARRFAEIGWPADKQGWAICAAWCLFVLRLCFLFHFYLSTTFIRILMGWPSRVMLEKFRSLNQAGKELSSDLAAMAEKCREESRPDAPDFKGAIDALRRANSEIEYRSGQFRGMLRSPFKSADSMNNFIAVFGSYPGWRWLLPMVPGGSGDPIQPPAVHAPACDAWLKLVAALDEGTTIVAEQQRAAEQWSQRVQALVQGATSRQAEA